MSRRRKKRESVVARMICRCGDPMCPATLAIAAVRIADAHIASVVHDMHCGAISLDDICSVVWAQPDALGAFESATWCAAALRRVDCMQALRPEKRLDLIYETLVCKSNLTDSRALFIEARLRSLTRAVPVELVGDNSTFVRMGSLRQEALDVIEGLFADVERGRGQRQTRFVRAVVAVLHNDLDELHAAIDQRHVSISLCNYYLVYRAVDLRRERIALYLCVRPEVDPAHGDYQLLTLAASANMKCLVAALMDRIGAAGSLCTPPAIGDGDAYSSIGKCTVAAEDEEDECSDAKTVVDSYVHAMRSAIATRNWSCARTILRHRCYCPEIGQVWHERIKTALCTSFETAGNTVEADRVISFAKEFQIRRTTAPVLKR